MDDRDAMDPTELTEARYELVISVDARRSGEYDDTYQRDVHIGRKGGAGQ